MLLEIPDDFIEEGNTVYVIARQMCIAYKPWGKPIRVKVSECSQCGDCCEKLGCEHLTTKPGYKGRICAKHQGCMRPLLCCISDPKDIESCTSRYK